eukprot:1517340-Pleurochrysis_carterae.AAC.1
MCAAGSAAASLSTMARRSGDERSGWTSRGSRQPRARRSGANATGASASHASADYAPPFWPPLHDALGLGRTQGNVLARIGQTCGVSFSALKGKRCARHSFSGHHTLSRCFLPTTAMRAHGLTYTTRNIPTRRYFSKGKLSTMHTHANTLIDAPPGRKACGRMHTRTL